MSMVLLMCVYCCAYLCPCGSPCVGCVTLGCPQDSSILFTSFYIVKSVQLLAGRTPFAVARICTAAVQTILPRVWLHGAPSVDLLSGLLQLQTFKVG